MKKLFSLIGLATIMTLSFIISEKTTLAIKDVDEIMSQIKEKTSEKNIPPENAIIKNDTIRPGIDGRQIDIQESYNRMRTINMYNEKYLIYKNIEPDISINKIYDKYIIGGNPKKKSISIVFIINENNNIEYILKILGQTNIKVTFIADKYWSENNNSIKEQIKKQGHTIEILNNGIGNKYCFIETKIKETLEKCSKQQKHTIIPNINIKSTPLITLKKNLTSGSIISLMTNNTTTQELKMIIDYINKKGYTILNLEQHLSEKNNN